MRKKEKSERRYLGRVITPANRREHLEEFKQIAIEQTKDDPDGPDKEAVLKNYPMILLRREQRHLKAYLKGEMFYRYQKQKFPVLDSNLLGKAGEIMDLDYLIKEEEE